MARRRSGSLMLLLLLAALAHDGHAATWSYTGDCGTWMAPEPSGLQYTLRSIVQNPSAADASFLIHDSDGASYAFALCYHPPEHGVGPAPFRDGNGCDASDAVCMLNGSMPTSLGKAGTMAFREVDGGGVALSFTGGYQGRSSTVIVRCDPSVAAESAPSTFHRVPDLDAGLDVAFELRGEMGCGSVADANAFMAKLAILQTEGVEPFDLRPGYPCGTAVAKLQGGSLSACASAIGKLRTGNATRTTTMFTDAELVAVCNAAGCEEAIRAVIEECVVEDAAGQLASQLHAAASWLCASVRPDGGQPTPLDGGNALCLSLLSRGMQDGSLCATCAPNCADDDRCCAAWTSPSFGCCAHAAVDLRSRGFPGLLPADAAGLLNDDELRAACSLPDLPDCERPYVRSDDGGAIDDSGSTPLRPTEPARDRGNRVESPSATHVVLVSLGLIVAGVAVAVVLGAAYRRWALGKTGLAQLPFSELCGVKDSSNIVRYRRQRSRGGWRLLAQDDDHDDDGDDDEIMLEDFRRL